MSFLVTQAYPWLFKVIEHREENVASAVGGNWFNQRAPWIRIMSYAIPYTKVNDKLSENFTPAPTTQNLFENASFNKTANEFTYDDDELRKKWVLYGGVTDDPEKAVPKNENRKKFLQIYDKTFRPMPNVTSLEVTNKGSWGAVREATIKYTVWSLEQLNAIEKLYMTLGIHCAVEWGWSIGLNPDGGLLDVIPPNDLYNFNGDPYDFFRETLPKLRENNNGCYDGMLGIITNFEWSLNDAGGFECSTTVASMGSTILAADVKSKSKMVQCKEETTDENKSTKNFGLSTNIDSTLLAVNDAIDSVGSGEAWDGKINNTEGRVTAAWVKENGYPGVKLLLDTSSDANPQLNTDTEKRFVTWGYIEDHLITGNLTYYKDCNIIGDKKLFTINSGNNTIYNHAELKSANPLICILPGQFNPGSTTTVRKILTLGTDRTYKDISNNIRKFAYPAVVKDINLGKDANDRLAIARFNANAKVYAQCQRGYIRNILVETAYIKNTFDESSTLEEFIINMLKGISEACGGIWDFSIMVNEDTGNVVEIIDQSEKSSETKIEPVMFHGYYEFGLLKTVSLSTQLDANMKGMIMYGTNRQQDNPIDVHKDGTSAYSEFFGQSIKDKLYKSGLCPETRKSDDTKEECPDAKIVATKQEFDTKLIEDLQNAFKELQSKVTQSRINTAQNALNQYLIGTRYPRATTGANNVKYLTLPIKLKLTIDGISGFQFGQVVDLDYKPARYSDRAVFMITNVTHRITRDGWETELDTILRPFIDTRAAALGGTGVVGGVPTNPVTQLDTRFSTPSGADRISGYLKRFPPKKRKVLKGIHAGEFVDNGKLPLDNAVIRAIDTTHINLTSPAKKQYLELTAAAKFEEMAKAYSDQHNGKKLLVNNTYRTYEDGAYLYQDYTEKGKTVASPGRSNHGFGTGIDLNYGVTANKVGLTQKTLMQQSPMYSWLVNNASRYGWKQEKFAYEPKPGKPTDMVHWDYAGIDTVYHNTAGKMSPENTV